MTASAGSNRVVEQQLIQMLRKIEEEMEGDCITYHGPIGFGIDYYIREAVEGINDRKKRIIFILQTDGGNAGTARRISDILRTHYKEVHYLIPSHAMSAGTILAMSGDAIWMDYYSVLGPIDPQVASQDGKKLIPALGYLMRYEDLLTKANSGDAGAGDLGILFGFDQGELYAYSQARALSISLLEEWLVKYKFKNWKKTEDHGTKVTISKKRERANEIANGLNDIKRWNSHGIGISMELLRTELNLKIDDFGGNNTLNDAVRSYHGLLLDYIGKLGVDSFIHTRISFEQLRRG
ncbi:MAG: serine dehydrogenasease [Candidatus Marinimicrobia bacterium]|nr:serine dehydrogenasease [Candidatus Neomarinimicrobiota bacterium]